MTQAPAIPVSVDDVDTHTMTASERQATLSLASLYGLRMLGLFLVLPVFALEAARYPGVKGSPVTGFALSCCSVPRLRVPMAATTSNPEMRLRYLGLFFSKDVFSLTTFLVCVGTYFL